MATYNGGKYIHTQLASILGQLSEDDEVVISDDGSTDNTLDIINSFRDKRIKVVHHERDLSLKDKKASSFYFTSYNFENAIRHATGDIVYLADQDDVWHDNRIAATIGLFDKYDIVCCNFSVIDKDNNIVELRHLKANPIRENLLLNVWKIPFKGCCMGIRMKALKQALPFPKACINHDTWIGCLLMHKGHKVKFVEKPLVDYRIHGSSVSPGIGKSHNRWWFKVAYRLRIIYQVLTY